MGYGQDDCEPAGKNPKAGEMAGRKSASGGTVPGRRKKGNPKTARKNRKASDAQDCRGKRTAAFCGRGKSTKGKTFSDGRTEIALVRGNSGYEKAKEDRRRLGQGKQKL